MIRVISFVACALLALPAAASAAPPPNDDFAEAAPLSGDLASVIGTTTEATAEVGEPNRLGDSAGTSVWYRWTPARSGLVSLRCESGFTTIFSVYRGGSLDALREVGSDHAGSACGPPPFYFRASAGVAYAIAVDAKQGGGGGEFELDLENGSAVPPNDAFANAMPFRDLGGNATVTGTTEGAGRELGEPAHGGAASGSSVWFSWAAQRSGVARVFPCHGSFHPLVEVFSGSSLASLVPIGTPAAVGRPYCTLGGRGGLAFPAIAGQAYFVVMDGAGGEWGWADLEVLEAPIPDIWPPQTYVTKLTKLRRGGARILFSTSEPGSGFACKLDGRPYAPCRSPKVYPRLPAGRHRFLVRATDPAGNVDATPATRLFRIERHRR